MTSKAPYDDEVKAAILSRILAGESRRSLSRETGIKRDTIRNWEKTAILNNNADVPPAIPRFKISNITANLTANLTADKKPSALECGHAPRILIYDIETLPNLGYFWDTISDRSIPLDFIVKPKSICTIAYKWYGERETYVLAVDDPYNDKAVLEAFLPEWSKANYVVAHYSRFDKPFIAARLMANGLPALPPVNDICTYKLAKNHFGRSLNGNKLDHLGSILGVGNKIKTTADLWVGCATGDKEAMRKMAEYNAQDVELLSQVFKAMLPYVKSKLNLNLLADDPVQKCKACGSTHIEHKGFEYTTATMRHRYLCRDCGSWSTFPRGKQ
jgi:RNase_H superfamily